ncbi:MAG: hypothetical protein ACJAUP_001892 [Cellvibrionaceae bacterium]
MININNSKDPPFQTIQQTFRATSYFSMTSASGYGISINLAEAYNVAIQYWVASGAIPDSSGGNVRVEQH